MKINRNVTVLIKTGQTENRMNEGFREWTKCIPFYHLEVSDLDDEAGSPTEEFKGFAGDSGMNRSQSEYCNVGSKTSLTNHPAKKYVFDFMRVLIMDNMCMTPASKQTPIIDMLLEVQAAVVAPKSDVRLLVCITASDFFCVSALICRRPQIAPPELSRRSFSPASWTASWSIFWLQTSF